MEGRTDAYTESTVLFIGKVSQLCPLLVDRHETGLYVIVGCPVSSQLQLLGQSVHLGHQSLVSGQCPVLLLVGQHVCVCVTTCDNVYVCDNVYENVNVTMCMIMCDNV